MKRWYLYILGDIIFRLLLEFDLKFIKFMKLLKFV